MKDKDIELKILEILVVILWIVILWAVLFWITRTRFVNWQNEYNNKDEQIKLLEQSLNEQLQEKEVYMRMLEEKGE